MQISQRNCKTSIVERCQSVRSYTDIVSHFEESPAVVGSVNMRGAGAGTLVRTIRVKVTLHRVPKEQITTRLKLERIRVL